MQGEVVGAKQLQQLGRQLEAESKKSKTAIGKQLREPVKKVIPKAQAHAREILPRRGGLNDWVAASKLSVRATTSGDGASVRLTATRKTKRGKTAKLQDINSGTVRHRMWGRNQWATQHVTPGWFTTPATDAAPEIQRQLLQVLDDITRRLGGSGQGRA